MSIADSLLPEFDQEMASTRKALERVPSEKGAWKPHPKSFPLGHLAQLVARMPEWLVFTLKQTELDLNPPAGENKYPGYSLETTETLLRTFDDNVKRARAAIADASDDDLTVPWSLKSGGNVLVTMPRSAMLRQTINHLIHHRGQLTVYLRLVDVPVPSIYGPTADENPWAG